MADADAAYSWIAAHRSPARAERWYQELFNQIGTLTRHPGRCPLARESDRFPEELRELLHGKRNNKYRILFTMRQDVVIVLYIQHAARAELET